MIKRIIYILLFTAIWCWAGCYYRDVFAIACENSFWVADTERMTFLLDRTNGYLWYAGRMCLSLYSIPWLGALLLALLLTSTAWFLGQMLHCFPCLKSTAMVQYLPVAGFLVYVTYKGQDILSTIEPGIIFGIPLFFMLMALCLLIAARLLFGDQETILPSYIRRRNRANYLRNFSLWNGWKEALVIFLFFGILVSYSECIQPNTCEIAAQQLEEIERNK